LFLSGEIAHSQGQGTGEYDGVAYRTRSEYVPTNELSLQTDVVRFGSHFYDGQSPNIYDKYAEEIGLTWKPARLWSLNAGLGEIRDNLDGHLPETTRIIYESVGIDTSAIKNLSLGFQANRLSVNTQEDSPFMTEFKARTSLLGIDWSGQLSLGDSIALGDKNNFWTGLRLRRVPRFQSPGFYVSGNKRLNQYSSLRLGYGDLGSSGVLSLSHGYSLDVGGRKLNIQTGLTNDLTASDKKKRFGVTSNINLLLDKMGQNRLSLKGLYGNGAYSAMLQLNSNSLFASHENKVRNVNKYRIRPSNGSVQGVVFVDLNNNKIYDKGEPGVPDVEVHLNGKRAAVTDKDGYYIFSNDRRDRSARVHLNLDTIPAIYTVTNGNQVAHTVTNTLTEVNLSVVPSVAIMGSVTSEDPNQPTRPVPGIRVILTDRTSGRFQADSFTASDGSYYFGEIVPGQYNIEIDVKTVPDKYATTDVSKTIDVVATEEEWIEIQGPDFILTNRETDAEGVEGEYKEDQMLKETETSGPNRKPLQNTDTGNKEDELPKQDSDDIWSLYWLYTECYPGKRNPINLIYPV
jgi:hypothetical protein